MTTALRVATLVLAQDYFVIKNLGSDLAGETLEVSKMPQYEAELKTATEEYIEAEKAHKAQMTPGISNPKASGTGRALQIARKKGTKARARVEAIKFMRKNNQKKMVFSDQAKGENILAMKNFQNELKDETIEVKKLAKYKAAQKKAEDAYKAQKAKNSELSGASRGKGGQTLAELGQKKRKAQVRTAIAEYLKRRGLTSASY